MIHKDYVVNTSLGISDAYGERLLRVGDWQPFLVFHGALGMFTKMYSMLVCSSY